VIVEIRVRSEISGSVWKIEAEVGDRVAQEDPLLILESMKLEIPLLAPGGGRPGDPRQGRRCRDHSRLSALR
jgi:acetyl-CoA carboxylase biotin carboxyl carrier protein